MQFTEILNVSLQENLNIWKLHDNSILSQVIMIFMIFNLMQIIMFLQLWIQMILIQEALEVLKLSGKESSAETRASKTNSFYQVQIKYIPEGKS